MTVKIRITGEEEEIKNFLAIIKNLEPFLSIKSQSDNYPNRNSDYLRKYIEVKMG